MNFAVKNGQFLYTKTTSTITPAWYIYWNKNLPGGEQIPHFKAQKLFAKDGMLHINDIQFEESVVVHGAKIQNCDVCIFFFKNISKVKNKNDIIFAPYLELCEIFYFFEDHRVEFSTIGHIKK